MNVILLENVENLGSIGDLVKVKPGYGRNYLLPQGKAALATPENMKEIEADAFEKVQVEVERSEIRMPEGPIQELGEFAVGVHLHPEVDVEVSVRIVEAD
jgi:large subunit ribosomal protein L9